MATAVQRTYIDTGEHSFGEAFRNALIVTRREVRFNRLGLAARESIRDAVFADALIPSRLPT